ncbi:MAG: nuclear transport factor 2 family protein [Actinomycetota bacterium]|nr:MAG: nuclear transport factor 2 family protein [Actinomycetota bacterium]
MSPDSLLAVVDRFSAAFDTQDVDRIMATMTPDCVFESTAPPDGQRHVGQRAVRAALSEFFQQTAGAQFHTEDRFGSQDRVVVLWRYDWGGADPGHVRGVDVFRVRDDLVWQKASYVKG